MQLTDQRHHSLRGKIALRFTLYLFFLLFRQLSTAQSVHIPTPGAFLSLKETKEVSYGRCGMGDTELYRRLFLKREPTIPDLRKGYLCGIVLDEIGEPVIGAVVAARFRKYISDSVFTGLDGEFFIKILETPASGIPALRVTLPGFDTVNYLVVKQNILQCIVLAQSWTVISPPHPSWRQRGHGWYLKPLTSEKALGSRTDFTSRDIERSPY